MAESADDKLIEVQDLKISFYLDTGEITPVNEISFSVQRGKVLAIVGESGCGKSVTALSLMKLIDPPGRIEKGRILFYPSKDKPIEVQSLEKDSDILYRLRGGLISMIFQEPMTALSPVHRIGEQICEAAVLHSAMTKREAKNAALQMLRKVGIPGAEEKFTLYPHEISGGMRQRVVIAMAMISSPQLLIADEPTTALDVTIQAQILQLIDSLRKELIMSVLLITHDMGVVAQIADEVAVMYLGRIVESAPVRTILQEPRHPYTKALLKSLPGLTAPKSRLPSIRGSVPGLFSVPCGCPFHTRCASRKKGLCDQDQVPPSEAIAPGHRVRCFRVREIDLNDTGTDFKNTQPV